MIADSSRLEILDLLSCGELCACDLLEHFSFSQPTLSHHMKVLKDNNLITSRKDGNKNLYKLNLFQQHMASSNDQQQQRQQASVRIFSSDSCSSHNHDEESSHIAIGHHAAISTRIS